MCLKIVFLNYVLSILLTTKDSTPMIMDSDQPLQGLETIAFQNMAEDPDPFICRPSIYYYVYPCCQICTHMCYQKQSCLIPHYYSPMYCMKFLLASSATIGVKTQPARRVVRKSNEQTQRVEEKPPQIALDAPRGNRAAFLPALCCAGLCFSRCSLD